MCNLRKPKCIYGRLDKYEDEAIRGCFFEQQLVNEVATCAPVLHVRKATRYNPDFESSSLSLILTYYKYTITNPHYMPPLGKIDNEVVNNVGASAQLKPNVWKANIRYFTLRILNKLIDLTRILY